MKKRKLSPYLLVLLSFLIGLLIGGFLLATPWAQSSGKWGNYADTVFMATSAICVTGFDCYADGLANHFTLFGQIVELILIQIGGLGFVTILAFILTIFNRDITFQDRYYFSQATNSVSVAHVVSFVRKLLLVTISFETIGFALCLPAFINMHGNTPHAYFNSVFHAVSAFNNAGLDLFGYNTSMIRNLNPLLVNMSDWAYYYLVIVTMILIILGGLSYIALIEIFSFKKKPHQWTAHTKICVLMAAILVFGGALLLFLTDGIINDYQRINPFEALFLSVSSRTAGFSTYDPSNLSISGRVVDCLLMFIGGGPLGTASGIKTTTVFIIMVTLFSYFKGRKVTAFNRSYSSTLIAKSMAVMLSSFIFVLIGFIAIASFERGNEAYSEGNVLYETISAFSNTGLSCGMPTHLSVGGKISYTVLMFAGRLGPMTMFSLFSTNMHIDESKGHVNYVEEDVLIG